MRIRKGPGRAAEDLHRRMERMMEHLLFNAEIAAASGRVWVPRADIIETETSTRITLEIPGVPRDAIDITVQGSFVRIEGVRREPAPGGCVRWHQMEIVYGAFERLIALPFDIDPERIQATCEDGFLVIDIRRDPAGPRNVPVEPL
ncbi:MAG TPA: Hsp20/alpha crystallin family protein [Candidatus Polarisedimenticolia bacterium]|nr:Hsp20/alpha crystallin family protein [Candidatus Polarisedimenticolia bacterium]